MPHKRLVLAGAAAVMLSSLLSCSPQTQYGDAQAVETITNTFGSTDLQSIAEAMTRSLLQSAPVAGAKTKPVITLAEVKNKTDEYIDTRTITEKIRSQLLKSGQVSFAVSISEMQGQVDELKRQNQSGLYRQEKRSQMGNMANAQFRIEGTISSIVKQTKKVKDVYYNFNLSLIDNESGLLEWSDEKEIRKTTR